jgi:hypothetical protein
VQGQEPWFAALCAQIDGREETVAEFIPPMLEAYFESDRTFVGEPPQRVIGKGVRRTALLI